MGNIGKQVDASIVQCRAIDTLIKAGKLETLSDELYSAAMLRKENPGASLSELCRLYGESITRSGLNHRLKKIIDIAEELSNGE